MKNVNENNLKKYLDELNFCWFEHENLYYWLENESNEEAYFDWQPFEIIDFDKLTIENDDMLFITKCKDDILEVFSGKNKTSGLIRGYYFSDDGRHDLVNTIAKYFSDKNIKVCNWLIYTPEEMIDLVDGIIND